MLTKKCFLLPCLLLLITTQIYGQQSTISFSFDSLSNPEKCSPLSVLLKNNSTVGDTFKWTIHLRGEYSTDEQVWSKKDLKYTFGGGTYEVRLAAYDTNMSYKGETMSEIEVKGGPSTIQMLSSACPGDRVEFSSGIDSHDGPENSIHFWWNFGDGGTSIMAEPKHSYSTDGAYTVKLIMLTEECGYDTITKAIEISTANTPSGNIYLQDAWNGVCPSQEVEFESNQSLQSYTYSWNFGDGNTSALQKPLHSYSTLGQYILTLTLTNACGKTTSLTDTADVKNNLKIETNFSLEISPQSVCIGDEVFFNFDKYDNRYDILWSFGDGDSSNMQTVEHSYKANGSYPITLKITNSCNIDSVIKDTINVSAGVSPKGYSTELMFSDSVCPGDNGLYYAKADMIPASNITWNFGDGVLDTGQIVYHTYATSGTYILKTTFKNGCNLDSVYSDTIHVSNNAPVSMFSKFFGVSSNFACPGDSLVFYSVKTNSFSWDFGDGFTTNTPTTVLEPSNFFTLNAVHHSYASTGTYIAKYSYTSCGKTYTDSIQIDVSGSEYVKAEFVTDKNIDDKGAFTALPCESIKFLTFGGAYYIWNFGDGTTDSTNSSVLYHTYTLAGTYTITLKTVNGCGNYAISSEKISILGGTQSNTLNLTLEKTDANCKGSAEGSIKAFVTGGSNDYSYKWNNGATTNLISNLSAGTYTVTVNDLTGCAVSKVFGSTAVIEPTALSLTMTSNNLICTNDNTGEAGVGVNGGTQPYSYKWSNNSTSDKITGLSAGTYNVTVADDFNCRTGMSVTITEPTAIGITITKNDDNCADSSGSATAITTGGTSPYSYFWDNGSTSQSITNLGAGTYILTVDDANGCLKGSSVSISASQNLQIFTTSTDALCKGSSDGSSSVSVSGGKSPYSYSWNNGKKTSTISQLIAGSYIVTVKDANSCTQIGIVTIIEPTALTTSTSGTNLTCNTDKSGSMSITVTGGTSPYNYLWSNGGTASTITNLSAGVYTVVTTDKNGCSVNNSVTLTEPTAISLTVTSSNANCGNSDGQATVNATGGTPSYTFKWSNGKTTQTITSLASGTYKVTVKDINGCKKIGSIAVGDNQGPTLSTTFTSVSCTGGNDGTATVNISGGIAPYNTLWDDPAGQATTTAVGLFAKGYTVQVTDASGCKGGATVTITEPTPLSLSMVSTDAVCHGESSGSLDLSVSGGTTPYSYNWSNGQITEDIDILAAGYYDVYVTDSKGCLALDSAWISEPDPVFISFDFSGSTKTITFSNMSDSSLTGWFWDFADGNYSSLKDPVHLYTDAGYYYVCLTGVSDQGCQSTECLYVEAKDPLVSICASYFDYDTTGPLTLAFYDSSLGNLDTWFWEFGDGVVSKDINPTHTYTTAGYYGICLTVGNSTTGCMATYCQNIKVEDATGQDSTSCFTVADFSFFPDTANMVSFSNKSIGYNSTYWTFGDGSVSVDNNTYHQYQQSGIYEVCLTVFDNATGCMNAVCKYVKIADPNDSTSCFTKAHFTFIPDTANVVNFKNKSLYYSESFWDFGDGNVSTEPSPLHTFPGGGFYNVCLTVKDSANCIASECILVEVIDTTQIICKAIFNHVQDITTNTVTFKDKSKGTVSSWFWDFGDGYAAMVQNPSHAYPAKGFYNVCLTMFDKVNGCMDTYCELIQVGGDSALTAGCRADFSFFPVSNYTLSFKDISGGSYNNIYWDFGDGDNSNQVDPQHTYLNTGFFDVCLTVFNDIDSCMNTSCKTIQISDTSSTNCNAFFNYFLDTTSTTVTFKDKSLGNPDYWYWNFNDFTVASNDQDPSHTFVEDGYYNVCLTIYKGTDCQNTYCKVIAVGDVSNDVYADFTYFADSLTSSAYFNDNSLGVITGWNWDYGDSQGSSFENPVHTYPDTGNYLVCLTVKNVNNVTGTKCKYIRIGNSLENACKFSCVWPGDANYSLEANHYDLLSIGLNYGLSGPIRDSVSTRWIGHYGTDWSTRMPNGINNKHSDCNGDGTVDLTDLDAIKQNFAYSHPYQPGKSSRAYNKSNPDLYFEVSDADVAPGSTVEVSIMAGRDSIALYGIGFEVKIDMDKVKQNSVNNSYVDSWLGNQSTELITYDKADYNLGEVFVGMTRFNQAEQKGLGSISKITFEVDSTFTEGDEIVICVNTEYGMDANGDTITFNSGFCDTLKTTGIDEIFKAQKINIYPNPTKGTIIFNLPLISNDEYDFVLINNLGQEVFRSNIGNGGRKELELNQFGDGLYFVQIISNKRSYYQKLNIVK